MANPNLPLFVASTAPSADEELVRIADDNLKDGDLKGVEFGDYGICLSKVGGEYHAIEDSCNHSGALLSGGRLEGPIVTCPRHFLRFSVVDGELQTNPKICDAQKVYPVVLKDGGVYCIVKKKPVT
jgi:3-phenylpropionate/trans-cinnamate dioxygenase ferredoxin subunit